MVVRRENGVLVSCDDCMVKCRGAILANKQIEHSPVRGDINEGRLWVLKAVLATLVYRFHGYEYPKAARAKILQVFAENEQFASSEVNAVLDSWQRAPVDAPTNEQIEHITRAHGREALFSTLRSIDRSDMDNWWPRISPPFGLTDCTQLIELGLCTQGPPLVTCESCGEPALNVPSRVGMGREGWLMHLGCSAAGDAIEAPAKKAHPKRRGDRESTRSLVFPYRDDNIVLVHRDCPRSEQGQESPGEPMLLRTIWVGKDVRSTGVQLSFVCSACGHQDALQPWTHEDGVEVVDQEDGEWTYFQSNIDPLLASRENGEVEFKETWQIDTKSGARRKELREEIAKASCGFMNAWGGTILVGVNDVGDIVGLDRDLAHLGLHHENGLDLLQRQVGDFLSSRLGRIGTLSSQVEVQRTGGGEVLVIFVEPTDRPVEVQSGVHAGFWVRSGPRTLRLGGHERDAFIMNRFSSANGV